MDISEREVMPFYNTLITVASEEKGDVPHTEGTEVVKSLPTKGATERVYYDLYIHDPQLAEGSFILKVKFPSGNEVEMTEYRRAATMYSKENLVDQLVTAQKLSWLFGGLLSQSKTDALDLLYAANPYPFRVNNETLKRWTFFQELLESHKKRRTEDGDTFTGLVDLTITDSGMSVVLKRKFADKEGEQSHG